MGAAPAHPASRRVTNLLLSPGSVPWSRVLPSHCSHRKAVTYEAPLSLLWPSPTHPEPPPLPPPPTSSSICCPECLSQELGNTGHSMKDPSPCRAGPKAPRDKHLYPSLHRACPREAHGEAPQGPRSPCVTPGGQAMSNGQGVSGSLGEWQPGAATGRQCHTSSHSLLSRPASPPRTCDPKPEPFVGLSSAQGTPALPCPASSAPTPSPQPSAVCEGQPSIAPPEPSQPTQQPQSLTQPRLVVGAGKSTQSRPQALPCWTPGHTPQNRPTPTWTSPFSQVLRGCQGPSGFSFWRQRCSGGGRHSTGPLGCWPAEATIQ